MAKVWTKYDTEFWEQMADDQLSDAAKVTHAESIAYLYRLDREDATDTVLSERTIRRIATTTEDVGDVIDELVSSQYWSRHSRGIRVDHHADVVTESLRAQRAFRERNARSQRAKRAREKKTTTVVIADDDANVSDDVSAGPTQALKQTSNHRHEEVPEGDDDTSVEGGFDAGDPWADAPVTPPGTDTWRLSGEPVARSRTA